jgi:hypothetical protein
MHTAKAKSTTTANKTDSKTTRYGEASRWHID